MRGERRSVPPGARAMVRNKPSQGWRGADANRGADHDLLLEQLQPSPPAAERRPATSLRTQVAGKRDRSVRAQYDGGASDQSAQGQVRGSINRGRRRIQEVDRESSHGTAAPADFW